MCCALNSETALQNTSYGLLVAEMQGLEQPMKVPKGVVGKRDGLKLTLDLHSNRATLGTISEDFDAFSLFLGGPTDFPVLRERSLQLQPGREHSLEIGAQVLSKSLL